MRITVEEKTRQGEALKAKAEASGYRVLMLQKDPRDGYLWTVLCDKLNPGPYVAREYVTWRYNAGDKAFYLGNYFTALTEEHSAERLQAALGDFRERTQGYY